MQKLLLVLSKCGTLNSVAGIKDDLFQHDEREAEVKAAPSDSEFDPHNDSLTNIFQNVLDEKDFSGFA
jgi:hypothetical protein